jgi:hypothetical protein
MENKIVYNFGRLINCAYFCREMKGNETVPPIFYGQVAERQGRGLQNPGRRFESALDIVSHWFS